MKLAPVVLVAVTLLGAGLDDELVGAARRGELEAVKSLVAKGASVNATYRYGQTALYIASANGHAEVVRFLADKGADVNVTDTFYKSSALAWSAGKGHVGTVRVLLEKGATGVAEVLRGGVSAGNLELVQAGVEAGKPKQEDLDRALAFALKQKQEAISEYLKKVGAK